MNRIPRPSAAMVVACVALLIALGGTSIAAVTALPPRSVNTTALQNGAVTTNKIANRAVTFAKLAPGARIPGPKGLKGDPGPAGSAGISAYETLESDTVTLGPNGVVSRTLNCPTGKVPLGGGFNGNATFTESIPFDNGWAVRGQASAAGASFSVFVVCAKVAP